MNTIRFWQALLTAPVALSAAMVLAPQAVQAQASGPVTAISELSDVQPTDWAFQALQSLVERYGCIAGYPDRTYRGNRAMTRFEFAAGMNACLDRINELIASGLADKVSKEDLATLQRLQEEFQAELTALKGRVDKIEGDVKTLQGQVFNPVTKLNVEVVTALVGQGLSEDIVGPNGPTQPFTSGGVAYIGDGGALVKRDAANVTLNYRVRLNFDASFTGKDRLGIRLQAREFDTRVFRGDPRFEVGGGNVTPATAITLSRLYYRFPLFNDSVQAHLGLVGYNVDNVLKYSVPTQALSDFAYRPNSTHDASGALLGFSWKASDLINVAYAYSSTDPTNPQSATPTTQGSGLFGGSSSHHVEIAFTPSKDLGLYLAYANLYRVDGNFNSIGGTNVSYLVNGSATNAGNASSFTVGVNWTITPRVLFTGWFSTGTTSYRTNPNAFGKDYNGFLVGFAFPDLFVEGAQGGITFGQPLASTDSTFLPSRPTVLDVYYSFPVSKYLTLTPGFYVVSNPLGGRTYGRVGAATFPTAAADGTAITAPAANDPSIIVGALRATFRF